MAPARAPVEPESASGRGSAAARRELCVQLCRPRVGGATQLSVRVSQRSFSSGSLILSFKEKTGCDLRPSRSRRPSNGGQDCPGLNYEAALCNADDCPKHYEDFRAQQCQLRNSHFEFQNAKHHWLPYEHPDGEPDERGGGGQTIKVNFLSCVLCPSPPKRSRSAGPFGRSLLLNWSTFAQSVTSEKKQEKPLGSWRGGEAGGGGGGFRR